MKKIIAVILLLCAVTGCAANDLNIHLTLTRGERSKDSHATTQTIKLEAETIVYDQTYSGRPAPGRKPIHKTFKLTAGEIKSLIEIIEQKELTASASKEFPAGQGYLYFDLSLRILMKTRESVIKISGKPSAAGVKEDRLYQNADALLQAIFRIIQQQDNTIKYRGMVE